MRNVIHYTDEYFELLDTVLDLEFDDATRNDLATKIFNSYRRSDAISSQNASRWSTGLEPTLMIINGRCS